MNKQYPKKRPKKGIQEKSFHKRRIVLDSALFLIIIVITSLAMIVISSGLEGANGYYKDYDRSDEYIETSMQNILDSTVPELNYYDLAGTRTELSGSTVSDLIRADISIRVSDPIGLNISNLEHGLESGIRSTINSVFSGTNFVLIAEPKIPSGPESELNDEDEDRLFITNMQTRPKLTNKETPAFTKSLGSSWSGTDNDGYTEIIIRFYLL